MHLKNVQRVLNEAVLILFLGGASLIFFLLASLVSYSSIQTRSVFNLNVYYLGSLLALLIYQPHFMATYLMNYSKGWDFLRRHSPTFLILPVVLVFLILLVFTREFIFHQVQELVFFKYLFVGTILAALWHFSAQAFGLTLLYGKSEAFDFKFKRLWKSLFFFTAFYGVFKNINFNRGSYHLFNLSFEGLQIPESILDIFCYMLIASHLIFLSMAVVRKLNWRGFVPWFALVTWYMATPFVTKFFYLIPVMHGMQFVPVYLNKVPEEHKVKWLMVLVIVSLLFIFILPNVLDTLLTNSLQFEKSSFFVVTLLCLNLHHFAMERISWQSSGMTPTPKIAV